MPAKRTDYHDDLRRSWLLLACFDIRTTPAAPETTDGYTLAIASALPRLSVSQRRTYLGNCWPHTLVALRKRGVELEEMTL